MQQLQDFLNECIKLGFNNLFFSELGSKIICQKEFIWNGLYGDSSNSYSYHDLFSVESGIMEFVEWKWGVQENDIDNRIKFAQEKGFDDEYNYTLVEYKYMIMGPMTAEQKVQYFLDNALLPTNK